MSVYLILVGLSVVLFLINIALTYRNRAEQARHKAEIQKTVADAMATTVQHRRRLDDDLAIVEEKHREETIIERAYLAERRDFDNDWGGVPIELAGNNAAGDAVAAAGPASVAGDQG